MQVFDNEAVILQLSADFADLVKDRDDAAVVGGEFSDHLVDEDFCSSDSERMNHMTDRGTRVLVCV